MTSKIKKKRFIHKLLGIADDRPQAPSQIISASGIHSALGTDYGLVETLGGLTLSDPQPRHPDFVGGFNPSIVERYRNIPPPSASPYSIPVHGNNPLASHNTSPMPQSLTMQMALLPEELFNNKPIFQIHHPQPHVNAPSTIKIPPVSPAGRSTRSNKQSYSPTASTSSQTTGPSTQQCAGITKAGKRCTRRVKPSLPISHVRLDEASSSGHEVFCFQHSKEILRPSGFYSRKDGKWVNYDAWIPEYLSSETQVALRVEMERARSQSDVPGYIYAFEIRDPSIVDIVKLKVGRAVNLVRRIDQWEKQCGSKEQVLRGWYPGTVEPQESEDPGSLLKGRVQAGERGLWCHRLERLIHLELADLVTTSVYLQPTWPRLGRNFESSTLEAPSPIPHYSASCSDCGSHHKEIFQFKKMRGKNQGKEWELIVQPVIRRWGTFVHQCV